MSSDDDGTQNKAAPIKGPTNDFEKFNARLDRLENLVLHSLDKKPKSNIQDYESADSSFSEDTQDWEVY